MPLLYTQNMSKPAERYWDYISIICLYGALMAVAFRLGLTNWIRRLDEVELLVFVGFIIGIFLGKSMFNPIMAFMIAFAYSLTVVPFQLVLSRFPGVELSTRLVNLFIRFINAISAFFQNQPVRDQILFLAVMSLAFWVVGLVAGYQLTRHGQPWIPVILLIVGYLIIDRYHQIFPWRELYSAIVVLLLVFLLGRLFYLRSRTGWKLKGIAIDFDTGYDLGRSVVIGGFVLVLISWNIPNIIDLFTPGSMEQEQLTETWDTIENYFSNAVASLQNPIAVANDFSGEKLALGTGSELSNDVVFTVQLHNKQYVPRYYWRGHSYSDYMNGSWTNTLDKRLPVGPKEWPLKYPNWGSRQTVDLTMTIKASNQRVINAPGLPLSINRNIQIVGDSVDGITDVMGILATPTTRPGDRIRLRMWVTTPTVVQLINSGRDYPDNIKKTYLQLPDSFSPKIRELAQRIAGVLANPYDQVMVITRYLRSNIKYERTIPSPPTNQDPIEWFLFDYKKGFCNYYATAEVLMLRSLGIPARLAVGYAEGDGNEDGNYFTVKVKDSHAWPEVFFYGIGWVVFEPTASQPRTELPLGEESETAEGDIRQQGALTESNKSGRDADKEGDLSATTDQSTNNGPGFWFVLIITLGGVLLVYWVLMRLKPSWRQITIPTFFEKTLERQGICPPRWLFNWARYSELSLMEKMFFRVPWMLRLFGIKKQTGSTPSEIVTLLINQLPDLKEPAAAFLDEYQKAIYSPFPTDESLAIRAYINMWKIVISRRVNSFFGN